MIFLENYIKKLRYLRYAENTIEVYICYLEEFFESENIKDPYKVRTRQIIQYLENREYSSTSQQNQIIGSLKLFAKTILGKKKIHLDKILRPRKTKRLQLVIPRDHILKCISKINNLKHKTIITIAYACGLRVSEILNLKWDDIDRESEIIQIKHAKGNKDRLVPINERIISLLEDYWYEYKTKSYVFSGQDWRQQYSASSCNAIVKKYIGKQYRFHSLRKSCATHLYELGDDQSKIQDLLGHERPETTRVYIETSILSIKNLTCLL